LLNISLSLEEDAVAQGIQLWAFKKKWINEFITGLETQNCSCLVIDEAQFDIELVHYIAKRNSTRGHFIFTGTPSCGKDCVDYTESTYTRCWQYTLKPLGPYEVLSLLKAILGEENISSKSWLQFWTIFAGEPVFYSRLNKSIPSCHFFDKKRLAEEGIYDHAVYELCQSIVSRGLNTGVDTSLQDKILKEKELKNSQQKYVEQLLHRQILEELQTISGFTSNDCGITVLAWSVSTISVGILQKASSKDFKSLHLRTVHAFQDMLKYLFYYPDRREELGTLLGCDFNKLLPVTLSYENDNDADILLLEKRLNNSSDSHSNLNETTDGAVRKPKAFVFNVKTFPSLFLKEKGEKSKSRFKKLCHKFKDAYDVHLCLACVAVASQEERDLIADLWNRDSEFYTLHPSIFTLEDFASKAPSLRVHLDQDTYLVDRVYEKQEIVESLKYCPDILVQGRYRVGKSTLLVDLADSFETWRYIELPPDWKTFKYV
jgi:hypothetical protein